MSHKKLRSREMQKKLRELRTKSDPFWLELNTVTPRHTRPATSACVVEDLFLEPEDEEALDDSDVSLKDVVAATHRDETPTRNQGRRISTHDNGGLMAMVDAEDIDALPRATEGEGEQKAEEGRGKRKKRANTLYRFSDFTRHWDNEAYDVE
jgi:hypothetical protein